MKKSFLFMTFALMALHAMGADPKFWISCPSMVADGKTVTYLSVYQTDSDDSQYWIFQVEIQLPKGIHIAQKTEGGMDVNDASLNESRFGELPHTLGVNMPDSTTLKAICVNKSDKETYRNGDSNGNKVEELFRVGLIADEDMTNGNHVITLSKAIACDTDVRGFRQEDTPTAVMKVTGGQDAEIIYTLGAEGLGTLILPFNAALPDDLYAYVCTGLEGNVVTTQYLDSIPANTPVLIQGAPGTYTFRGAVTATETSYTDGLLTGVFRATEIEDGYVFSIQDDRVAFYAVDGDDPTTIPANHCYLSVPYNSDVLNVEMEDPTGITSVGHISHSGQVYDLTGKRTTKDTKGIVIVNGKKMALTQ